MTATPTLDVGKHSNPEAGLSLLEAVAYVAGEPVSDGPDCTSKVLGAFGRGPERCPAQGQRQRLVPLIPQLIDTRRDGHGPSAAKPSDKEQRYELGCDDRRDDDDH